MDASSGAPIEIPFGFSDWHPAFQILFFSLAALISEDATMVSAAVLAGTGQIARSIAFLGAFFGIWIGDFLLYLIAFKCRNWAHRNKFFKKWTSGPKFAKYENWFHKKGWQVLVISRFLPGTRVGCFVAAGYLRMKIWPFVFITFTCAFIWATIIFLIFERVGNAVMSHLHQFYASFWIIILIIAGAYIIFKLALSLSHDDGRRSWKIRFQKLLKWEFWPGWAFYTPVFLHYFFLVLKYRSLTLPTISNPGMENGGFVGESKAQILQAIKESGCPQSLPFQCIPHDLETSERLRLLESWMDEDLIEFPIILKPDVGQRGQGVKLVANSADAYSYLDTNPINVICQKTALGKREAGIFYIREPKDENGFIFSITEKVFPSLEGDGKSNLKELIWAHSRAKFQHKVFFDRFEDKLEWVPNDGEIVPLVFAGNHAQGTMFLNGDKWISPELEKQINIISKKIDGFNFGRYDVRFDSTQSLMNGEFEIIELNGASSEATSIYDPSNPIWSAYNTLFKQWDYAFKVGDGHRKLGLKPIGFFGWFRYYSGFKKMSGNYSISD